MDAAYVKKLQPCVGHEKNFLPLLASVLAVRIGHGVPQVVHDTVVSSALLTTMLLRNEMMFVC